ncbi:MAG: serine 3-dehydrogenase [Alphaproteobacteria bacterium]|nr:MAG: serine 3-dehydrogenase [Alphaproteobacteria bacterium]
MRKPLRQAEAERLAAVPDLGEDVFRHGVLAPNGKPILDLPQVIQKLTASHQAWDGAPGHPIPHAGLGTVTYAFFNSSAEVYSSEKTQFQPLSEAQRIAVRDAFAIWGEIAGITFVEGTVATADINIGGIDPDVDYYSAYANYPGFSAAAGDVWIRSDVPTNVNEVGLSQAGFRTLLHEIGHALGLSHPGAYNATEGVEITYAQNAEYYQDSLEYTIMSYFASSSTGATRTSFAATPMAHDIAAMQSLYGPNMNTRAGDTHYGFNSDAGRAAFDFALNTAPVVAIWDAGGRDTLDFSGWSGPSRIDLNPGASSDGGGQTRNVQIAFGATIENAIAGGGDDSLTGNNASNLLIGNGGNDVILGGKGTDRIEGGAGGDVFAFGGPGDSMDYTYRSDGKKLSPDIITDFVSGTDKIDLSAIDADAGTEANDAFAWIGAGAFTGVAGQLRAEVLEDHVHILGDMNGDGRADLHIIAGGTVILASDFVF